MNPTNLDERDLAKVEGGTVGLSASLVFTLIDLYLYKLWLEQFRPD